MPRGKSLRKNKRNENALITRLMQISLAMDDHIYCGKLISASDAGGYLQEISTLRLQCLPTNVRALQVIEKLTRCMKSILTEENTGHSGYSFNKHYYINTQCEGSTSPVYSLPDEDKIRDDFDDGQNDVEIIDMIHVSNDETNDNINSTHKSQKQTNKRRGYQEQDYIQGTSQGKDISDNMKTNKKIDVIDITSDIEDNANETDQIVSVCKERNISIEQVNSEVSKMDIRDEPVNQTRADDANFSQNILDNYDDNIDVTASKVNDSEKYHKTDAKAYITNKVKNYFNTPLTQTNTNVPSLSSQQTNLSFNIANNSAKHSDRVVLENNNMGKRKKKTGKRKDGSVLLKGKPKFCVKSATQNNTQSYQNNTMICNEATKSNKKNAKKTDIKMNRKPKKKDHQIYNNNVENDLSWVENLRYVREICPDENDPSLATLEDNFWDNFALPDTWNDSEFE